MAKGWNSYPRPQLRRESYLCLNGTWKLNNKEILIPFPPQSTMSGYEETVGEELIYETTFYLPESFTLPGVLLHFGAVDQEAKVYVNGELVGEHKGGYLPFSFPIEHVVNPGNPNLLRVEVVDRLGTLYPYGKQKKDRGGMWYTQVSGIWQTVWLENVPSIYIEKVTITPSLDRITLSLWEKEITTRENQAFHLPYMNREAYKIRITSPKGEAQEYMVSGGNVTLTISDPMLWTPEEPNLYDIRIETPQDAVDSYFALRQVSIQNKKGIPRLCLNNQPIFMHGILDQGYFPEGIFLPETEEGYTRDILNMKELGFNMLRKHIKIEPEIFYYECDRLGMLVVQDMVNNGPYSFLFDTALPTIGFKKRNDTRGKYRTRKRNREIHQMFESHMRQTLTHLYNHPCIIGYTIFNEGWGQFDSDRMYDICKSIDSTRFYDSTSGWFSQKKSDVDSEHVYFRNKKLTVKNRPLFLSECGGFTYLIPDHAYNPDKTYGYGTCKSSEELTDRIIAMYETMVLPVIPQGMCGCVYTQLSDIEDEINGLYTYDRQVLKVIPEKFQALSALINKSIE